jgi:DNA invertase Pin-like site-specific DNA recombinase
MSTDQQKYSIANQKQAIAEYAQVHDIDIIRTYADEGRSVACTRFR